MANDQAMEDVQNVFRHTIMERFYNLKFPDTRLSNILSVNSVSH
jgi:hypothetical protein